MLDVRIALWFVRRAIRKAASADREIAFYKLDNARKRLESVRP